MINKHFGNCKDKYIRKFSETTPQGNEIEGYICKKSNRFLGSLVITQINGEPTEQFVQSMPKIEYFMDERDMNGVGYAFEKLDGSCLIMYPLLKDGKIIEIVPKTRGRAVADSHFLDLYKKLDTTSIEKYYKWQDGVLMFEMYGILNQHEIIHYQTGIDIALIGVYRNGKFFRGKSLKGVADKYNFKTPDELFSLKYTEPSVYYDGGWSVYPISKKYPHYLDYGACGIPTKIDAIDFIREQLEELNKKYYEKFGRIATEGVVINTTDSAGNQRYLKVKPRDIMNKHRCQEGIPRKAIVKEVLKYFDDYGSEVFDIYTRDPKHHTEYIERMLLEDYAEEFVRKSRKKIEKVFMQIWDAKQIPQSLHDMASELYDEYKDYGITHCMRMFAQKYPMKKKDAKTIYQILDIKFKRDE